MGRTRAGRCPLHAQSLGASRGISGRLRFDDELLVAVLAGTADVTLPDDAACPVDHPGSTAACAGGVALAVRLVCISVAGRSDGTHARSRPRRLLQLDP